jgi:hypothetical protein
VDSSFHHNHHHRTDANMTMKMTRARSTPRFPSAFSVSPPSPSFSKAATTRCKRDAAYPLPTRWHRRLWLYDWFSALVRTPCTAAKLSWSVPITSTQNAIFSSPASLTRVYTTAAHQKLPSIYTPYSLPHKLTGGFDPRDPYTLTNATATEDLNTHQTICLYLWLFLFPCPHDNDA